MKKNELKAIEDVVRSLEITEEIHSTSQILLKNFLMFAFTFIEGQIYITGFP